MAPRKIDPGYCGDCSQPNNVPPSDSGQPWRCDRHVGATHPEQQLKAYDEQCYAEAAAADAAEERSRAKAAWQRERAEAAKAQAQADAEAKLAAASTPAPQ